MDSAARLEAEALLLSLRQAGAAKRAPGPLAYLVALARRREAHAGLARQRLDERLRSCAAALLAELGSVPEGAVESGLGRRDAGDAGEPSPLAALVATLNARLDDERGEPGATEMHGVVRGAVVEAAPATVELKAVRQHRQAWARLRVGQQLQQSAAQAPDNPGPLNSQALVLRALQTLQEDAPDYLQALVTQVESWWWLEQAALAAAPVASRAVRRGGKQR